MNLVLLYDTDESDFAGDLLAFLRGLDLSVETVMCAPNRGRTLHKKEQDVLDKADVFIFLLTPGSERHGQTGYPSQSVCDEMGRAKERFKNNPERVIYLADSRCHQQAIDQLAYTSIDRSNDRSVVRALAQLVLELREIEALKVNVVPKTPDMAAIATRTSDHAKAACAHIAGLPNGIIGIDPLNAFLSKITGDPVAANIVRNELTRYGWINYIPNMLAFGLSNWGYDLIKYERSKPPPPPAGPERLRELLASGKVPPPFLPPEPNT